MLYKCPNPKCGKLLKWDKDRKKTQVRAMKGITQPDKTYMVCRLCKHIDDAETFRVIEKKRKIKPTEPR